VAPDTINTTKGLTCRVPLSNAQSHDSPCTDVTIGDDGDKPVSRDVFAIWRGVQDWIVETGLLSPLDLSLRLMPSRNCIVRYKASVVQQVDGSTVGSTRRLLMSDVAIMNSCCLLGKVSVILSDYGQRNRGSLDSKKSAVSTEQLRSASVPSATGFSNVVGQ